MSDGEMETEAIRNRDIPILRDVLSTMQLVSSTERQMDWQHERMLSIRQHISGMPGGGALPKGLDDALCALEEAGERHSEHVNEYLRALREAEDILNGIQSRTMLALVVMKYVMNLPDAEIRRELGFGEKRYKMAMQAIEKAQDMRSVAWREKYIFSRK